MNKILKTHYCVHLHPNNCCTPHHRNGVGIVEVIECTFIRKDRVKHILGYCNEFPHPLDTDNAVENPRLSYPEIGMEAESLSTLKCLKMRISGKQKSTRNI